MRAQRPATAVTVVALMSVLVLVAAATYVLRGLGASELDRAVRTLPDDVLRVSFTDWAAVEELADGSGVDADSRSGEFDDFLDRAFDADLLTQSAVGTSFVALADNLEITPLDLRWEVYGQARESSVAVLALDDDVDIEALEGRFADLGYDGPDVGPGEGGTWVGSPELVAGLEEAFTPLQENLAVLDGERLLVMADSPDTVSSTVRVIRGDADSLDSADGVDDLIGVADDAVTASVWVGDFVCEDLSMGVADTDDQAEADALVEQAGGVRPLTGFVLAQRTDRDVVVGMLYPDDDTASEDLQARVDLAAGPAPGQGGTFAERFAVTDAVSDGRMVRMVLNPKTQGLVSDIGQAPVLFATC